MVGGTRTRILGVAYRDPRRWTTTTVNSFADMNAAREGSNPRLPGNSRTSFRSTTWHRGTATGSRTPASGLRARRLDRSTIAACVRKRWDSHPQGPRDPYLFSRQAPHLAGSLPSEPCVSPARFERATSAFGGRRSAPLSYGEVGVDGRGRTCILRFRSPVPSPFGHVDMRATDGTRTRNLRLDGPALQLAELRRHGARPGSRTQSCPGVRARCPTSQA